MAAINAVLLDRDGTLIKDKHYLADPAGVELLSGAAEGLRVLCRAKLSLFVVTNQSGIGRGYFSEAEYHACHAALERLLRREGVTLAGSAFCPHAPEEGCACRKPGLAMWETLAGSFGLAPSRAAMVGDKEEDLLFGLNAGFPAVALVLTGKGEATAERLGLPRPADGEAYRLVAAAHGPTGGGLPHAVARDLAGAARFILDHHPAAPSVEEACL
jgi:D-glycero-D-manno-heptose 1,7-bisphosphate phosphatase